ncbi:JNK-interacting protein 3, partial [Orchesella cincta]
MIFFRKSTQVQALAGSIYQEFERMINKYDEDVVKDLMPLVVNVLENLDLSYTENQEHEVEVELLREDNEQLVTQYEREKALRKTTEQKLLEIEDQSEEQIKDLSGKIESLEAILRMLELKSKNAADHVSRLEDKEAEMKKEYAKLHDRYTELFKTHMDYMERTKILMGTDRLENFGIPKKIGNVMSRSTGPVSFGFESLANNSPMLKSLASPGDAPSSGISVLSPGAHLRTGPSNIQEEMSMDEIVDGGNGNDSTPPSSSEHERDREAPIQTSQPQAQHGKSRTKKEERTGNTLYQEFSFQEPEIVEEPTDITGSWVHPGEYASSGMGKEVENLIMENNELLATKNALNIVKDDLIAKVDELTSEQEILREEIASLNAVKSRLKLRVQELEDELKKIKEDLEKKTSNKSDDEEDVPLAQRKRFTRVEMARVLMERNQYKERFMELQDAVRWTEMLRAAKQDPSIDKNKNNRGIFNFFSNLFSKTTTPALTMTTDRLVSSGGIVPHSSPTRGATNTPAQNNSSVEPYRAARNSTEMPAEKLQLRRLGDTQQRRDQTTYSKIKAHVRKDDGRMQAYGWSLPAKAATVPGSAQVANASNSRDAAPSDAALAKVGAPLPTRHLPVPVPIYCRPFMEQAPGMKIFCASGVDLSGGSTKKGELSRACSSPHVWICTATHPASRVTIIDANRPADVILSFDACQSHLLCIAAVPGLKDDDLKPEVGIAETEEDAGGVSAGKCGVLSHVTAASQIEQTERRRSKSVATTDNPSTENESKTDVQETENVMDAKDTESISLVEPVAATDVNEASSERDGAVETEVISGSSIVSEEEVFMSSVQPTMWLGAQSGFVYVHSAVAQWERCLHRVRLPDSVLSITHLRGRVFVSMANGTIAIFRRAVDGQWNLSSYYLLDFGQQPHHSIRCLSVVHDHIWCGFRNKIHVVDVSTLLVKTSFEAHPRKESQVRQMACYGDGVWVSIRLDSTLRLYHATTFEHLQDVDIEPYVSKMLGTGKLGFSYARITALLIASHRLWIGTGNGVIISVPLSESVCILPGHGSIGRMDIANPSKSVYPGAIVRVTGDEKGGRVIPYCSMSQAQLSFHGHRDAVKFFVAVPGAPFSDTHGSMALVGGGVGVEAHSRDGNGSALLKSNSMLVISGGEGYIDFRV